VQAPLSQDEGSRLEALRSFHILDTFPEQAFEDLVCLATVICDTPIAKISFVDQQRVWLKGKIGFDFSEIPRERSFSAQTILRSDILIVADPLADEMFRNNLLVTDLGVRFFAGMPLITASHQAIGAISVMDRIPHLLTTEQIESLKILARRIMHELEQRCVSEAPPRHQEIHLAPSRPSSATILVVEDDENMRDLLQRTLAKVGFTVLTASDGVEALDLCQRSGSTIDLVVSDIVMPRLNGLEFSKRIRAARTEMKFLFITGYGDQFPELAELVKSGASVLQKPFLPADFLRRIGDALGQRKLATGTEG